MRTIEEDLRDGGPVPGHPTASGQVAVETGGVIVAQIVGMGLRYACAILSTRILGASWYGSLAIGMTIVTLLATVAGLGLSPGALPFLARAIRRGRPEEVRAAVRTGWFAVSALAVTVSLVAFALAPWIGVAVFDDPRVGQVLRPLCLFVLFSSLTTTTTGFVQILWGPREQAIILRVLTVGATLAGLAVTWWFGLGIVGVVASNLLGPFLGLVVALPLVLRRVESALRPSAPCGPLPLGSMVRQSAPLMGVGIFAFILMWMDVLLMGVFRSSDEVGIYGVSARLALLVVLLLDSAGPVFLTRFSLLHADGNWPEIRSLYRTTGRWSLWSGVVIASVFCVWGTPILSLFGPEFAAGLTVLGVLSIGRAISASFGMCGRVLAVSGYAHLNLMNMVLLVAVNGILDYLWIPRYGGLGAAGATCITIAGVNFLQSVQVWYLYRMHPFTRRSPIGLVGPIALAGLAWPWREGSGGAVGWLVALVAYLVACGALYLGAAADEEDRAFLRRLWKRLRRAER